MKVYRAYPNYIDPEKCPGNLSIYAALELLNAPEDVVELVKEAIADGEII